MESSEDDAGTATSASRGASARETDDGKSEDVDPTPRFQHESSEARMSCSTPTMSEDNFDGDSVPSPSAQDVNTSTEAILDMIDEFVDGPGAPKRLSLVSNDQLSTESTSRREPEPPPSDEQNIDRPQESSPVPSTETENNSISIECLSQSVVPDCANTGSSVSSPSTDTVQVREVESNVHKNADLETEYEPVAIPTLSSLPSSSVQTLQDSVEVRNVEYGTIQETETVRNPFVSNSPSSSENAVQETVQVKNIESHSTQQVEPKSSSSDIENETAVVLSVPSSPSCSEQTQDFVQIRNIKTHSTLPSEPRSSNLGTEKDIVTAPSISISSSEPLSSNLNTEKETVMAPSVSISSSEPRSSDLDTENETVMAPSVSISSSEPRSSNLDTENETVMAPSVSISSSEPRSSNLDNKKENIMARSVSISSSEPRSSNLDTEQKTVMAPSVSISSSESKSSNLDTQKETVMAPSVSISLELRHSNIDTENETVTAPSVSISLEPRSSNLDTEKETVTAPSVSISSLEPRSSNLDAEKETVTAPPVSITSSEPKSSNLDAEKEIVTPPSVSISLEPRSSVLDTEIETVTAPSVSISSSTSEQSVQNVSDSSDCNRTVKIVTSSDIRDSVTVERAESTSSECSVTESRCLVAEPATRTPLRRRLVRPVPSDRRPDSTVSSTVDSQTPVNTISQTSSEVVMKDVSSSSDAVPSGNTKPEEISNVSEISICKAETSSTPSKKIKLIRPKITPATSNSSKISDVVSGVPCKDQCQSTSSDDRSMSHELPESSLSMVQEISKPQNDNSKPEIQLDVVNHNEIVATPEVSIVEDKSNKLVQIDKPSIEHNSEVEQSTSDAQVIGNTNKKDSGISPIDNDHDKKVPPIKLSSPKASPVCKETLNEPQIDEKSDYNIVKQDQKTLLPEKMNCEQNSSKQKSIDVPMGGKKVPPIKLSLSASDTDVQGTSKSSPQEDGPECSKHVPKLTIKLGNKQSEDAKGPIPKLTIKPIRPPTEDVVDDSINRIQSIPNVTKLNIKPIIKPIENDLSIISNAVINEISDQVPCITKLNIKPILKPPEKINDIHRKSSSSEISESEYSENDDSTGTSDQASASDQGSTETVPKVTIKLGKPGTESEGKFYTEQNIPKLTIKTIQQTEKDENESRLKLVISQSEEKSLEKVPKFTIKTVSKSESQPLSPKLTIKPIKPPETANNELPKLIISAEPCSSGETKDNMHVPKITIKPVTKTDSDLVSKTKKSTAVCDSSEHIPLVTKLNIKPIIKPEVREDAADLGDKVPVVSKLNIKPIVKPKEVDSSVEDVPKIIKLNIKPLKSPEENSSEEKDCDDMNADNDNSSIPVVTKLNIKPIVKPVDDACKDTRNETEENQSSETGNSSDENNDHIPIVTKLNIKPIVKPSEDKSKSEIEENIPVVSKLNIKPIMKPENTSQMSPRKEQSKSDSEQIPVVTKLNIKPLIKPEDTASPASPKRDSIKLDMEQIPVVTKINIKPIIKPEDTKSSHSPKKEDIEQNIPVVTKLNIKPLIKPEETSAPASPKKDSSKTQNIPVVTKLNIKPIVKPDETIATEIQNENLDKPVKNPPLVMKINMKNMSDNSEHDHNLFNNIEGAHSPKLTHSPKVDKSTKLESKSEKVVIVNNVESEKVDSNPGSPSVISGLLNTAPELNCVPEIIASVSYENKLKSSESRPAQEGCSPRLRDSGTNMDSDRSRYSIQLNEIHETNNLEASLMKVSPEVKQASAKQKKSIQNCTLLKKLLSSTKDNLEKSQEVSNNLLIQCERIDVQTNCNDSKHVVKDESDNQHLTEHSNDRDNKNTLPPEKQDYSKHRPIQVVCKEVNESVTRPLEITVNEKVSNQSSGQDSPRIILKINKTDHGASAKIITEETHKVTISPVQQENTNETVNDKQSPKKQVLNSRRKAPVDETTDLSIGKRLRSSRIVENADKTPILRRNLSKRPSGTDTASSPPNNEGELSVLDSKRLKLEQILSANKSLSITPVVKMTQLSPTKATSDIRQGGKTVNQLTVNNENCPKNGNSKLHNILTNLQVKQMQSLQRNDSSIPERTIVTSELESNTSTGSSDVVVEITRIENCHPDVQEMMINENSDFRDMTTPEEISQDPLDTSKTSIEEEAPKAVESTPQPRKRGRPRKIPVSEGPKEVTPIVTALEERPQRSLRLTRERPAILAKPRGRGRGRGRRVDTGSIQPRSPPADSPPPTETVIVIETLEEAEPPRPATPASPPIDPTSSRIKLPRMTEALDKSTNTCSTPLTTRRRSSLFGETSTDSNPAKSEEYMKSPEVTPRAGRGGRGSRGGPRGRTPRNRGRGRGGGRGATYMKETMGIYGRVCGPATTTVELFEEETCMMDDNATPSKPSHLLDEDSQSSVKSSTNDSSNKMKKSKFADIFDSSKVWTAADVKEYTWPPPESSTCENQVMMIQEQVAMFLGVKSFKRRYPELKRRPVVGEEKDYVLTKGVVTEALCDLGITAVDASEVLDIMLSDYPHKYEEYRSHQRQRQLTEPETTVEVKQEDKPSKVDVKSEKTSDKPEPPKVDPEKARQEMAAAAIASALEWNARCNAWRRPACVDLQTMTVHRRRAPAPAPARPPSTHCRPPAGFYPHALLPGQFQHHYRTYTPEQLRYFPLNTVIAAPPAPPSPVDSSSESEGSWGDSSSSSDDSELPHHLSAKRKKLTKVKRSSQQEKDKDKDKEESRGASGSGSGGGGGGEEQVDTCRVCKLRLEANRKYTHERFLVCAHCNAKLHPSCLDLNADTIRKCREYAWQCAECKSCCACRKPQDDDKMLFCDLCDRGFHIYCVGLDTVPQGRWHCVECAICKSCGAREPEGLPAGAGAGAGGAGATPTSGDAEWHHQTRRGPGGHKVYSHSLCTPCARAYRIGRYCPLCERSFIGPKGTMQLVICKLCDRQLHQECVRPLVSALNVLDYTCGECRRGGITSRAAAVRLAPRTIATLFMAKRRFNKYAHRQYMASRLLEQQHDDDDHDPDPDPGD